VLRRTELFTNRSKASSSDPVHLVSRVGGLALHLHDQLLSALCTGLTHVSQALDLFVRQVLNADEEVLRSAHPYQLVKLYLDGSAIAVLRILNKKYHQKRDNGGAGVDDQLPSVGVVEQGSAAGPYDDGQNC